MKCYGLNLASFTGSKVMVKLNERETSYERHLLSKFLSCFFSSECFFISSVSPVLSQSQAVCIFTVTTYYG